MILKQKKRVRPKKPTFYKQHKIQQNIDEMNTIEGIELYKPLYEVCRSLYMETLNKHLECLNYYKDIERDTETGEKITFRYAEIKDTWELPLKERYQKHLDLLEKVMSNDITLVYCDSTIQSDNDIQLTFF